jgi:hypothetical protein
MTTLLLSSTVLESNSTASGQLATTRPDTRSSTYYDEAVDNPYYLSQSLSTIIIKTHNLYLQLKKALSRNPCWIKMCNTK